jgi:hypothetical protein
VVNARAKATQITLDPENLTPEKLQEFQKAQGELGSALGRLIAVQENYPDLKANENFKGTDGTEVGLYGGPQPFNLTLSYPLISTMEVGEKTDDNGQLEVTIGVK